MAICLLYNLFEGVSLYIISLKRLAVSGDPRFAVKF